jgi:transposase
MSQAVRRNDSPDSGVLYMAMELSKRKWKLAFSDGHTVRQVHVDARDLDGLVVAMDKARKRFGMQSDVVVRSCYEAGLDGFWIHRWLESLEVESIVVDPASVEVSRRARKRKTDRLDAEKLVRGLIRHYSGESRVWSVINVPSEEHEDQRRPHRELKLLKNEKYRLANRIWGTLMAVGICDFSLGRRFEERLDEVRQWNGEPLPAELRSYVLRTYSRLKFIEGQMDEIDKERKRCLEEKQTRASKIAAQLLLLKAIGENGAWTLATEFFSWREFKNGKEVGALAGLTGTPHDSGGKEREQGISKAGNKRVRTMAVELAWCWLRWQPQSALSLWYQGKFGPVGKRLRRIGIVALARKLLVALWRFVEFGVVPQGAILRTA